VQFLDLETPGGLWLPGFFLAGRGIYGVCGFGPTESQRERLMLRTLETQPFT